jgi:hypothetical protein
MVFHTDTAYDRYPSEDIIVRNNYITNKGGGGEAVKNLKIFNNYYKNVSRAHKFHGGKNIEVYNNIYDITNETKNRPTDVGHASAVIWFMDKKSYGAYKIYNNTLFIKPQWNKYGMVLQGNHTNTEIKNNIIFISGTQQDVFPIKWAGSGITPIVSKNCYYNPNNKNRVWWNQVIYSISDLKKFKNEHDDYAIFLDPLLSDPENENFSLSSNSPCINENWIIGAKWPFVFFKKGNMSPPSNLKFLNSQ